MTRILRTDAIQVAVIPVRRSAGGSLQVCLIRRRGSGKWGIPKGFIDPGFSHARAALAEADEEAGLDGRVVGGAIGTYEYEKRSRSLTVAVYVMEVHVERATWLEMRWRKRRWYSLKEAGARLKGHHVSALYERVRSKLYTMLADALRR